jgi:hypothetical protein
MIGADGKYSHFKKVVTVKKGGNALKWAKKDDSGGTGPESCH